MHREKSPELGDREEMRKTEEESITLTRTRAYAISFLSSSRLVIKINEGKCRIENAVTVASQLNNL